MIKIIKKSKRIKALSEYAKNKTYSLTDNGDTIEIDTNDTELISYIESNFEDYESLEDLKLRLDAIEALVIGEQSTLSKIRSKLGL